MNKHEETFELIVNTLLSTQPTKPEIIKEHVQKYAQAAGIPYSLAVQAVTLVVKDRIQKKLNEL